MLGSMMRRAMLGDDAKLSLDFTSTLPAGVTFTRAANTATRINSSGLIETMSADQPRFDHDPTTGLPRGLLIEASATNLQSYSEDLSQTGTWTQQALAGVTANASGITDPAGGTSASKIRSNSAAGTAHLVYSSRSTVSGIAYTMSAWIRAAEYNFAALHFASGANRYTVVFDLTTGVVTQTNTFGSPTGTGQNAVKFGNWWRLSVTMNAADTTSYPHICLSPTGTPSVNAFGQPAFSGTAESGVYVWGAQLETGSGASSYIPTGASQATRNPDICTISGAAFSSWYNASEGTFFADFRRRRTDNTASVLSANNNTTAEVIELVADTVCKFNVTDGGASQVALFRTPFTANTDTKLAGAFKLNDCNIGMGGSIGTTDTTATMPTVDRLFIGRDAGAVPVYLDGHVKFVKFYDARKTDTQLQALTT